MSTKNVVTTVRPAIGGLDLTADPTILDPNYLVTANNIIYKEGGQRKRRPGFIAYQPSSSSAGSSTNAMVSSTSNVRAISDSWDYSTGVIPVQRLIAVTGASIFRSTGDGLWTAISGTSSFGSNSNLQVCITQAQNYAVISDGVTAPVAYNLLATTLVQPTTGALLTFPVFEASVYHQSRLWMLGIAQSSVGNPSSVIVGAASNIFDSTGTDTVTLDIDSGDGDRVIGASQSFFGNLYIFKGPQFGSIHQISGNTSTSYIKNKITRGAPAHSHHGIITTPTDIYWISHYGVHSLQTTIKYGDVEQAYLSLPIQTLWRENLITQSDIHNAKGFWNPTKNIIGWFITPTGSSSRYWCIVYNYALSDPTPGGRKFWSLWMMSRATGANWGNTSAALILNPSGNYAGSTSSSHAAEPHLYFGADNGLVYQGDYRFFDDDGTPYPVSIKTPILTRFKTGQSAVPETSEKQFTGIVTYYVVNNSEITSGMTYAVTVDNRTIATGNITGGAQGAVLGTGVLGVMILGGLTFNYEETIIEGRGRGIQIEWFQTNPDQDFEHLGYSIRFVPTETQPLEAI